MRIIFAFLLSLLFVLLLLSSCKTTNKIQATEIRDSVRISDSIRTRDSVVIERRDSVVITEQVKTTFRVEPCDSVKPFDYTFERSNVFIRVFSDNKGGVNVDIDVAAARAYYEKIINEYREREKLQQSKKDASKLFRQTVTITIVKKKIPFWLLITAIASVALNALLVSYLFKNLFKLK